MRKLLAKISNISNVIVTRTVLYMSTMTCVMLFLGWSLLPLVFPKMETLVFYVSGGVIQLVALPLIMVGQRLNERKSQSRSEKMHAKHDDLQHAIKDIHLLIANQKIDLENVEKVLSNQRLILAYLSRNKNFDCQRIDNYQSGDGIIS